MKKKIFIVLIAIIAIVSVVLAAAPVDAWVSVGCPHCGQTNAVHVTQGDIDQGIQFAACKKCNKHFSVYWVRKNGAIIVTDVRK